MTPFQKAMTSSTERPSREGSETDLIPHAREREQYLTALESRVCCSRPTIDIHRWHFYNFIIPRLFAPRLKHNAVVAELTGSSPTPNLRLQVACVVCLLVHLRTLILVTNHRRSSYRASHTTLMSYMRTCLACRDQACR